MTWLNEITKTRNIITNLIILLHFFLVRSWDRKFNWEIWIGRFIATICLIIADSIFSE